MQTIPGKYYRHSGGSDGGKVEVEGEGYVGYEHLDNNIHLPNFRN